MHTVDKQEARLNQLIEVITAIASLDFKTKAKITGEGDLLDVISIGFNMLSEALEDTVVSKEALVESEERFRRLAECSLEGIIILNNGIISEVNQALLDLFLYQNQSDLLGFSILKLFHESCTDTILEKLNIEDKKPSECKCIRKDGHSFFAEIISRSVPFQGESMHVITFRDITERKEQEQKILSYANSLEKTNKELNQFAYIVSHDLKAPLRAISSLSTFIAEDIGEDIEEDVEVNINLLQGRVHRMQNLINGILDYSRIGRTKYVKEEVDLHLLLKDIIDGLLIDYGQNKMNVNIHGEMPILYTGRVWLQQVFQNLLSNAVKYNDKEIYRISIFCTAFDTYYEFSIKDNGIGIAKRHQDKVFIIFQTLNPRDKIESTGVGLSIVKKIIEEQGGAIWLESEKGVGTTFMFKWMK